MTDLTPDHPAVQAATRAQWNAQNQSRWCSYEDVSGVVKYRWHREVADALTAALPYLTADDLRDAPAGRELMAEAWEAGVTQFAQHGDVETNPYRDPAS